MFALNLDLAQAALFFKDRLGKEVEMGNVIVTLAYEKELSC